MSWRRLLIVGLVLAAPLGWMLAHPRSTHAPAVFYVAAGGSDAAPGTFERPFGSLALALTRLRPGDTLFVRGGRYVERVQNPPIRDGLPNAPIHVAAWPGERPVIVGLLWIEEPTYWRLEGLNVTWDTHNADSQQHMVKFSGGHDWTFTNAEVWGARSYAGILITGGAYNWTLRYLYVHDTLPSNGASQDQLIYVSEATDGVIEHCLLVGSENGRGIKLGHPTGGVELPSRVTIRFNTLVHNLAGNISTSYDARDNLIYGNILVDSGRNPNIAAFKLVENAGTVVRDNIGWASEGVVASSAGLLDEGNLAVDPMLDSSYRPTNPVITGSEGLSDFGYLARTQHDVSPVALTWQPR